MRGMVAGRRSSKLKGRALALLAGTACAVGALVPSVSSAFSSGFDSAPVSLAARGGIGSFTPASVDPRLAVKITVRALADGKLFRFTPAGSSTRPDRSVTVAVRVDEDRARAISVRSGLAAAATAPGVAPPVRIAPTAYNLGRARGYKSFAPEIVPPRELQRIEMPDLAAFAPGKGAAKSQGGRFAPQIELDREENTGRAPRTLEGENDYSVDLGGSYRVSRNLKVTAGVRYSSERDRIAPLTDGTQDSQAVYVGTQFRF